MYCKRCGNVLAPTDVVCNNCGEPVNVANTNQINSQVNPQTINPNMNFQNNNAQLNQSQNQNVQDSLPVRNMNNVNSNMQQPIEQNLSQNFNSQPNNLSYNQNMNVEQFPNQNFNSNQSFNANQPENGKKKSNLFIIIVIVLVLIIGVLGYFVVSKKVLKGADEDAVNSSNNSGTTSEEPTQVANANSYSFQNFEFPIPSSYYPSEDAERGSLQLINNVDKIMAEMFVWQYVTIDDYKAELSNLKSQLATQGIIVNSDTTKTVSGVDWIILYCSTTYEGKTLNVLETFASLGNYHVLEIMIGNYGTKSNEYIFTDLSNMISNTTYRGTKNFSSNDKKENPTINGNYNFDESIFE